MCLSELPALHPVSACPLEDHKAQPPELVRICSKYASYDGLDYQQCANFLKEVEAIGYTFEYGLDGVPFGLCRIDTEITATDPPDFGAPKSGGFH